MRANFRSALSIWEREHATTLAVFAAVPEGKNDQTVIPEKGWTLADLVWHICISERWFCTDIMGVPAQGENPLRGDPRPATVAGITEAFRESHATLVAAVAAHDEAWVDGTVDFYGEPWIRLDLLHLMLRHEAHHRGQLSMLMMVAGGQPPTIYGAPGINLADAG
jgi:uncharacterized damage-inducible protein DinB